jgi:hypothetical protein
MEVTSATESARPHFTGVQLEPGWDVDVAAEDRPTVECVLGLLHEMGTYHRARTAAEIAAADGTDAAKVGTRPGVLRYWVHAHGAPHWYYEVLVHYTHEVRFTAERQCELVAVDRFRIHLAHIETGWDDEVRAFMAKVRIQQKASPAPLVIYRLEIMRILGTATAHTSAPVPVEGLTAKRTRDGTYFGNGASPRAKTRRQSPASSPRQPGRSSKEPDAGNGKGMFNFW